MANVTSYFLTSGLQQEKRQTSPIEKLNFKLYFAVSICKKNPLC